MASRSPSEVIAETNNILSTPYQGKGIEFRKYYLQRYFPETIAYLDKKLADISEPLGITVDEFIKICDEIEVFPMV